MAISKLEIGNPGEEEDTMDVEAKLNAVYAPSEDVVVRKIDKELIIIPLVIGLSDMDGQLFTLNETGSTIWQRLNGKKNLKDVIQELSAEFKASGGELEGDVIQLVNELLRMRMLVEISEV